MQVNTIQTAWGLKIKKKITFLNPAWPNYNNYCCRVRVACKQQHNQDLRRIYYIEGGINSQFITFYQIAVHLTRVHCGTFCQSALQHEQQDDVTLFSHSPFAHGFPVSYNHGQKQLRHSLKKTCFVKCVSFSISNFHFSTPSPLFNVVTTWQCPWSVFQHWKGGEGVKL